MAMIRVEPTTVQVRTSWLDGRPTQVTWREETLPVTRVSAIRHEDAAYPVMTGPRTLFEVTTPKALLLTAEQVGSKIVQLVRRPRAMWIIPWGWTPAVWLNRFANWLVDYTNIRFFTIPEREDELKAK